MWAADEPGHGNSVPVDVETAKTTWTVSRLYIHVEKDFQSHHMQIYSSTLMGGQERERKCVRNA